ncbi:nicotinate phosphoribosyltransferase [Desulfoluna limicola]|uniref:Nicotinate phosphoribosyltransferase n=1 Tax=Desulfoluna limicola TaxID=2810562 RepID=A0ABN6EZK1_9BACT|nr:nicotinate phosphoribosyltransferase [Desulfoluna limicola]BCS95036.1 nicotinate phosphoribosyltransferase [Desulfoluna limicola]
MTPDRGTFLKRFRLSGATTVEIHPLTTPIIQSLLDTDLYKLTMMQGVLHQFPWAEVEYEFRCRNLGIDFAPVLEDVDRELDHICRLRFSNDELEFLEGLRFIKRDFIEFLRLFRLNREFITAEMEGEDYVLKIKGPWLHTILYEVPVLAIINEVYFRHHHPGADLEEGLKRLRSKIDLVKEETEKGLQLKFSDFGTRRRFSRDWQETVIKELKSALPDNFMGTSNVYYAWKYNLTPVGTMAHEWLMACQALGPRLADSQKFALEHWAQEYRGDLGIALSDVAGFDAFLKDFDMYFAKLFDGCRHDSGDPIEWGEKLIAHYESLRINAASKVAVFSDGLSFPRAIEIARHFEGRLINYFGIGTNLTNDVVGEPLQIVIKMTRCQGTPVAKLSDSPGKQMCDDQEYLDYMKRVFGKR